LPDEDAAVPEVFPGGNELLGLRWLRLLLELDSPGSWDALPGAGRSAELDVAVAGRGVSRADAKGEQRIRDVGGELLRRMDRPAELLLGLDHVVGRHHDDGGVR